MTIEQIISELEKIKEEHGDMKVYAPVWLSPSEHTATIDIVFRKGQKVIIIYGDE